MHRRIWAALCAAALTIALASATPAGAATNPDDGSNLLPTGHCLRASSPRIPSAHLQSRSHRFVLYVSSNGLDLDNQINPSGSHGAQASIWRRSGPSALRSSLCMHSSGNLVFRSGGRVIWSTHTAQSGRHNRAELLDSGSLVVRTRADRTVWSTHTTAVLMKRDDRLGGGHRLVNRTYPGHTTSLEMRSGGDLVVLEAGHVVWRTKSHRPGSYLSVTKAGRAVVRGPAGHTVWRSPAVGRHAVLSVDQLGSISLRNEIARGTCWDRPAHQGCT